MSFVIHSCKTGKCWNQNVFKNLPNFVKFLNDSKNRTNVEKSNSVLPGKGRDDRALLLTYLDSPMAEGFPHYCLDFDFGHLHGETGGQSMSKRANIGSVSFS